jgi:phage FluMu gp28-like protein
MAFEHVFHKAFLDTKRYSIHHYPSDSSPLVSPTQLAEWRDMMTLEEWQREVEALWVEATQTFFPMDIIVKCIDSELDNTASPNQYLQDIEQINNQQLSGRYFGGLDLGKQIDFSVLAVVQQTENGEVRLVHKRQFPLGTPYPEVIAYAAKASQAFSFDGMYVDKTGIGDAVVDEHENIDIPEVKGVFFTDIEKENMLNFLKLLMEKKQLRIQGGDKQLIAQINEQQYEHLQPSTAQEHIHMKYRHPKGRHEDQLFALALACYATKEAEPEPFLAVVPR